MKGEFIFLETFKPAQKKRHWLQSDKKTCLVAAADARAPLFLVTLGSQSPCCNSFLLKTLYTCSHSWGGDCHIYFSYLAIAIASHNFLLFSSPTIQGASSLVKHGRCCPDLYMAVVEICVSPLQELNYIPLHLSVCLSVGWPIFHCLSLSLSPSSNYNNYFSRAAAAAIASLYTS